MKEALSDIIVRFAIWILQKKSRFVVVVQFRGDSDYLFSCRGTTTPREAENGLANVGEDIATGIERREIENLIHDTFN